MVANAIPTKGLALQDYLMRRGGTHLIKKILIANNGMAATKAIISMRQWCYLELGNEKSIEFIVMATPEDLLANAEFIRLADGIVEVPGGSNRNNYANVDLIVELAKKQGVDAVWPGWGHASENPALPKKLSQNGIQFIGPTSSVMAVLGDKIGANILAQTADVPSIPWSGDGLTADLTEQGTIPEEIFNKARVSSLSEAIIAARRIGFPVMVKASEGGGGKGIRMSNSEDELTNHFLQVQNEVVGSPIFMMQLCTGARHIEVQIVGDEYGNAIALNGRDCSTQRRFQKIFEEGPPTIVPPEVFSEMEKAAQRLTQNIGYRGAGTVEYLYNPKENKFYFLELNPRLQVEHPVTEGLTGMNLPSLQLQVAMGIALNRIPDIRELYGLDRDGFSHIDFVNTPYKEIKNHVIAARITAENPDEAFKPTSGRIERVKFQSTSNVWGYFSVGVNGGIHEFADSQFGHLFASGPTRDAARKSLILALKEIEVRGEIRTTVEYLVQLLETKAFKENTIDTAWLDGLIKEKAVGWKMNAHEVVTSAVIYRAFTASKEKLLEYIGQLEKGQTGLISLKSINNFPIEISFEGIKYSFQVNRIAPDTFRLSINDKSIDVHVRTQPEGTILATFGGQTHLILGMEEPLGLRMVLDGKTVLLPNIFDPSELRSDITGKVVRYLHANGANVKKGEPYVEVEAMKMIMSLKSAESGAITYKLSPGSIISAGDLVASLKLKDPSKVNMVTPFTGDLNIVNPKPTKEDAQMIFNKLSTVLDGYELDYELLIQKLFSAVKSVEEIIYDISILLEKYLSVEEKFAMGTRGDAVITELIKENKNDLSKVINIALSHQQLSIKNRMLLSLLRGIQSMSDRFGEWKPSEKLSKALLGLSSLQGKEYGEIALVAGSLLTESKIPPFASRLEDLRTLLRSNLSYDQLSLSPSLAAGVDLLSALFDDPDPFVRDSAAEVYIRRVYKAHKVISLDVKEQDGILKVRWTFQFKDTPISDSLIRYGLLTVLKDFNSISIASMNSQINELKVFSGGLKEGKPPLNVVHTAFLNSQLLDTDEALSDVISNTESILEANLSILKESGVRSVSYLFRQSPRHPRYLSFGNDSNFKEEPLKRDMRPSFPYIFELDRLSVNYNLERLATVGKNNQVYLGVEKSSSKGKNKQQTIFLRAISHRPEVYELEGANAALLKALDELERVMLDPRVSPTCSSRIFLNMMPELEMDSQDIVANWKSVMDSLTVRHATRLLKLRVDEIEVKARIVAKDGTTKPIRLMSSSMSGEWLRTDGFLEYPDHVTGATVNFSSLTDVNSVTLMSPYPTSNTIQLKRAAARRIGTTYAYDFLGLIQVNLIGIWEQYLNEIKSSSEEPVLTKIPPSIFKSKELVLENGVIEPKFRIVGSNKIGMLAWHTTMRTPEYPEGRDVVFIANDVTFQSGSFGIEEDEFFKQASEYARKLGIPRIYLASNSGARIGLVDELKSKIKVAWNDVNDPTLGFKYLYLPSQEYYMLPDGMVNAVREDYNGEVAWRLDDIIGTVDGIGVENLRGSGTIAGETSRAYSDIFTLSYVTGRSVGIGAYLVRLGQRTIQMKNGPIILTGFQALNKLLGREVYTSQDQLGGPQIMAPNGISHLVVENDKEGVAQILRWLSYVPKNVESPPPQLPITDPIDRKVEFVPPKTPYDPREMCMGKVGLDGTWISGFFDHGSYQEYMADWGKSVVVGRARLGGIPMGVINVETRLSEQRIPADPANPDSREVVHPQAGQVWFPDSSYKTAQAINDFNKGENLPLMIFANWRGFSGGTRDMFGEVLKFGAQIVDALVAYKHPVFVYIPPNGELRGGAWVVVDPTINEEVMEMYADIESRGGILEPPGICEVKFRGPDQKQKMYQLDPVLKSLVSELEGAKSAEAISEIKLKIEDREKVLMPLYLQVAHEFADLHDRAGRMKAKGVVREVIDWKTSREYFYWRTKRRLAENKIRKMIKQADPSLTYYQMTDKLQSICAADWDNDMDVLKWFEGEADEINTMIQDLDISAAKQNIDELLESLGPYHKYKMMEELKERPY
eukprot:CAMPEP_0171460884 /NCGR_PEP_ID=MMETSP0945-20130129/5573_1 /TAXON_ID=109269 /ORGANISM="Vaucheria litorea, Strain CCMP2940" /LENGTH=2045 /DNA_ID=CAMNT_0011987159 /DNA_START=270 /DNA_END=6407 /DNA_ORIENTATION=+